MAVYDFFAVRLEAPFVFDLCSELRVALQRGRSFPFTWFSSVGGIAFSTVIFANSAMGIT